MLVLSLAMTAMVASYAQTNVFFVRANRGLSAWSSACRTCHPASNSGLSVRLVSILVLRGVPRLPHTGTAVPSTQIVPFHPARTLAGSIR
ncbi:Uncharacterised protein [Mycobacteroides abscessus subsp. massiliense]|nr:Uncharacterised protein [Mycobacteroides abscessus subsp. massiliense]